MAILKQNSDNITFYQGWYGECDGECTDFELITGTDVDSTKKYTQIHSVYMVRDDAMGHLSYNGGFENGGSLQNQQITHLECGKSYVIILDAGESELDISGFVVSNSENKSYRMTDSCESDVVPTPTPKHTPTPTPKHTPTPTPKHTPTPTPKHTPTPTPKHTPTPTTKVFTNCCDGMDQQTYLINGEAEPVNQVSVTGSPNGTLCWNTITGFSSPTSYLVSFEDDTFSQGGLQISITGSLTDKTFRFTSDSGICYEGELEKDIVNIFDRVSVVEKTPTPTPTPKQHTPTPTPVIPTPTPKQHTPTPTPSIVISSDCCDSMDQSTKLTDGDAESVNQVSVTGSPNGTLCWNSLTGFNSPSSYLVSFEDETYSKGGLQISITGSLTDKTFRFTTDSGICYEGELENSAPTINVFNKVSESSETPTPTEPTPTPSPTPIDPTPTPIDPTPTPLEPTPIPIINELEWRWYNINGEETLQVKHILRPSNSNFSFMDVSLWTTVYGFQFGTNNYNLDHASWPDASVSSSYLSIHSSVFEFDGLSFALKPVGKSDLILGEYHTIEITDFGENTMWSDSATTQTNELFVYVGNINNENSANQKSNVWPTIIKSAIESPTPTPIDPTPTPIDPTPTPIDPTPTPIDPTPTPEPVEEECCNQRDYSVQVISGSEEIESINQVSVVGSPNGTLCWNELTGFSSPSSYLVSFEDDTFSQGGLQISITGNLTDKTFRYTTQENICYEGILDETAPTINVFNRI
jgi:cell division septation protein DedD